MKVAQFLWEQANGWADYTSNKEIFPQLVLYFGSTDTLAVSDRYDEIRAMFPDSVLVGCTTAGEIIGDEVIDDSIVLSAIEFADTHIEVAKIEIDSVAGSREAGQALAETLPKIGLKAVFVISDGQQVNGSELVNGLTEILGQQVIITGGLAGDGGRFEKTLVGLNESPASGNVVVIGLYGDAIQVGHGSVGGWDTFGPKRTITRSQANVLYELDGKPALQLYKDYLGEKAEELPGAALEFPLMIRPQAQSGEVGTVRTILAVDEATQSMVFAGDMPEGYEAQLMMANFENLIDGASEAAKYASLASFAATENSDSLAILISCVGRKMVLGQRTGDEVESVMDVLGGIKQMGFYSYGEISPHVEIGQCQLHNQTMTITSLTEKV